MCRFFNNIDLMMNFNNLDLETLVLKLNEIFLYSFDTFVTNIKQSTYYVKHIVW